MRYVLAKTTEERTREAYRIYVTDMLFYQAQDMRLTARYEDLIRPKRTDTRTGDEIALDVITRLGLKVGNDESMDTGGGAFA